MKIRTSAIAACAVLVLTGPAGAQKAHEMVTPKFNQAIPNTLGKSLVVVEMDYATGAGSPSHTHAPSAFIYAYVLAGRVESRVNDAPARIYRAGEGWFESPKDRHLISRNASKTAPAKLPAVFILDSGERQLTMPAN